MINIYEECREYNRIGISGHIKPDGDCIGAVLALYLYLNKRLPNAEIIAFSEEPASCFAYIRGIERFNTNFEVKEAPELMIALDTVSDRLGGAEKYFQTARKTINIDHHISNASGCGDVNYVDAEASSTSELIYRLIEPDYIDREIAEALYLGIVHDTGVFRYSNTSPETLTAAAHLITYGFDFSELIDKTFYEKTYIQNLALGRVLLESRLFLDGKLIVGYMDEKTMTQMGLTTKDFDGIINQLRITEGVECAAFIYQMNAVTCKVSLRSKGLVDVSAVAVTYGGGGHRRASGFYVKEDSERLIERLVAQVCESLKA